MKQSDYASLLRRESENERQLRLSPYYLSQQQQKGYQITQTRIEGIERTEDNVYVNVVLDHPDATYITIPNPNPPLTAITYVPNGDPVASDYGVTKTEPILLNCSEYYCSVIRFTIPLDQVPLLICPIVPNQANSNLTPLIIGIQNGLDNIPGSYFSSNLIYFADNNFPPPPQNQPVQVITPYYFINSYQILVNMINTALATSYVVSGLAAANPGLLPPYFEYNPVTDLFSLIVPAFLTGQIAPPPGFPRIYMNDALATFLFSFVLKSNVTNESSNIHPFGNDYFFILERSISYQFYPPGVTVPATTAPPNLPAISLYYKYTQEYSIIEYWTSLRKIIIISNTIPVKNEYVPATNNVNNAGISDQSGVNVSYPILTDFVPNISSTAGDSRSIAYYVPQSQYRLVDLISTNPLQKIDIRIFWQDREGNLYPLLLSLFQQASLKIGFFKKNLYNGTSLTKV